MVAVVTSREITESIPGFVTKMAVVISWRISESSRKVLESVNPVALWVWVISGFVMTIFYVTLLLAVYILERWMSIFRQYSSQRRA